MMSEQRATALPPLREDIFEEMRLRLGCMYISDIRRLGCETVMRSFQLLPEGAYSHRDRQDFVRYVQGDKDDDV